MARTLWIAVVVVAMAALQAGCSTAGPSAQTNGDQLALASAEPTLRLGAGDQLGENMFRHYTQVARRRHERMAQAGSPGEDADQTSDNVETWFVVLPHRRIVVFPGVMLLQPADGHVHDATMVHQLLPS